MPELPIDVIPGKGPVRFRWTWATDTVVGPRTTVCEGSLASSAEGPVADLIGMAKRQAAEIKELRQQIQGHCDRIAAQSELLSKRAEAEPPVDQAAMAGTPAKGRRK